jgi:hypothetical protein
MLELTGKQRKTTYTWLVHYGQPGPLPATAAPLYLGDGTELPVSIGSGDMAIACQTELTGQAATNGTSAMTRNLVSRAFAMSPRVHKMIPYTSGTVAGGCTVGNGGSGSTVFGIASNAAASARVKLSEDFGFADANAGSTFGFAMPFALRVPLAFSMLDGAAATYVIRIYACTQGTMTLPAAGSDPYPANTRGICAELRQKSGGTGFEARLCARDGTSAAAGTFVASEWVSISSDNAQRHYDFVIESTGDGTAMLYVSAFAMVSGEYPESWHGNPIVTLSTNGVPKTNSVVASYWSTPEVAVIGNGVAVTGATRYIKLYQCAAVYGG